MGLLNFKCYSNLKFNNGLKYIRLSESRDKQQMCIGGGGEAENERVMNESLHLYEIDYGLFIYTLNVLLKSYNESTSAELRISRQLPSECG